MSQQSAAQSEEQWLADALSLRKRVRYLRRQLIIERAENADLREQLAELDAAQQRITELRGELDDVHESLAGAVAELARYAERFGVLESPGPTVPSKTGIASRRRKREGTRAR
jgi:hypothetical protein